MEGVNKSDNAYLNKPCKRCAEKTLWWFWCRLYVQHAYIVLLTHTDKSESVLLAQTPVQHALSRRIYLVSETAPKWLL